MVYLQFFATFSLHHKICYQIAATSGAHAHDTPESVPTAEEAKPEDEFQFIRDAAKRDNVELLVSKQQ
jgi:hypothetical protein